METSERQKAISQPKEIIDVLSGEYQFHYTSMEELSKILNRGIYSGTFAERIGDSEFKNRTQGMIWPDVFLTSLIKQVWGEPLKMVGIIVDAPQQSRVPLRISPRQFVGIVVPDESQPIKFSCLAKMIKERIRMRKSAVIERVNQIVQIINREGDRNGTLPIYGISGDLYWPRRMSHEEIVKMLGEKNGS